MYAEAGLFFPYMQNFGQDIQQLEEYCKSNKPNCSMVCTLALSSVYLWIYVYAYYSLLFLNDLHFFEPSLSSHFQSLKILCITLCFWFSLFFYVGSLCISVSFSFSTVLELHLIASKWIFLAFCLIVNGG